MLKMSNPVLDRGFEKPQRWDEIAMGAPRTSEAAAPGTMTLRGTILASFVLLGLCAATAYFIYFALAKGTLSSGVLGPVLIGSVIANLALGLIITFKPPTAVFLAPVAALSKGVMVGALSYFIPLQFNIGPGVVMQAMGLTFGIFAALLIAYSTGLVRLGGVAARVVMVATAGIALFYLVGFIASQVFGYNGMQKVIWDASPLGIGFSLVVVVLASLNLVLDFQMIDEGQREGLPRHMEWYGAYGLLVTVVWLYIEVLRLLAKLQSRD